MKHSTLRVCNFCAYASRTSRSSITSSNKPRKFRMATQNKTTDNCWKHTEVSHFALVVLLLNFCNLMQIGMCYRCSRTSCSQAWEWLTHPEMPEKTSRFPVLPKWKENMLVGSLGMQWWQFSWSIVAAQQNSTIIPWPFDASMVEASASTWFLSRRSQMFSHFLYKFGNAACVWPSSTMLTPLWRKGSRQQFASQKLSRV